MRSATAEVATRRLSPAAGGTLGGLFFFWVSGMRVLTPTEVWWVMQLDWRIHFLGWHFFRREPWSWPPGVIQGYFAAPDGTALAFTDSIPLVALLLKPFTGWLPPYFQYLGLWLLVCFVLQGVFGALLVRLWTTRPSLQLLGAFLFVLMPTLLIRVGHPSLCAHWLLLWAMWLYLRGTRGSHQPAAAQAPLGLVAGLMHPYLAVMVALLLAALWIKDALDPGPRLTSTTRRRATYGFASAAVSMAVGWWASGLFTVTGAANLASEGLGRYSMNLLSPITPSGWSTLLPAQPVATDGQAYEGFQYLGAGALMLMAVAGALALWRVRALPWRHLWPLLLIAVVCALYALSPVITVGADVVLDLSHPVFDEYAWFRATGRFFWPLAYLMLAAAVGITVARLPPRLAMAWLVIVVAVQMVDLRGAHLERHRISRSEAFHAHRLSLTSPLWERAMPHYRHLVLLPPKQCGVAPVPFEWLAFLTGRHGLTINGGEVARYDTEQVEAYCLSLTDTIARGALEDDRMYVITPSLAESLQAQSSQLLTCLPADDVMICVTERSAVEWLQR